MRVFVDANVLISVLNKEYPAFTYSSRVLSMSGKQNLAIVTSALCLAIAFYFVEKKHGQRLAKSKISLLAQHLQIAEAGETAVKRALENKRVIDFEDGLQYYSAIDAKCSSIVTFDQKDYHFSDIEVVTPEQFLKAHA